VDFLLQFVLRAEREHQCENEEANGVSDDVVSQQRGGNDARCHLRARDLNRHQQRTEREDQERERDRDKRLQQGLGAGHGKAEQGRSEPGVNPVHKAGGRQFERNCDEGNDPE
jgi:hypothetical protein